MNSPATTPPLSKKKLSQLYLGMQFGQCSYFANAAEFGVSLKVEQGAPFVGCILDVVRHHQAAADSCEMTTSCTTSSIAGAFVHQCASAQGPVIPLNRCTLMHKCIHSAWRHARYCHTISICCCSSNFAKALTTNQHTANCGPNTSS